MSNTMTIDPDGRKNIDGASVAELTEMANQYLRQDDLGNAYPHLALLAERQDHLPETSVTAGLVALTLRRAEEARFHFERAIQISPRHYDAHYNLFLLFMVNGEYDEALRRLEVLIAMYPDKRDLYNDRAVVAMEKRDSRLAVESFSRALAIDPNHLQTCRHAIDYIVEQRLFADGTQLLDKLIENPRTTDSTRKEIGRWRERLDRYAGELA
ncbi:MAG: tetratricopeptide repeat protein [candidate division Zixibacteria bacterium]|nr:tetratricopeptide repeat protein [candidate division Zixibacteria bacterium]